VNECFRSNDITPKRFYVDTFANGIIVYTCFFDPCAQKKLEQLAQTLRYVCHFKHTPRKSALVWDLVLENKITPEHAIFLITAAKFIFSFFPKETQEYLTLAEYFKNDPSKKSELDTLFRNTMSNAITYERIYAALTSNYTLTLPMFDDFKKVAAGECKPFYNEELAAKIDDQVGSLLDAKILKTLLKLNAHLQMTNFFKPTGTASAIAMRFDGEVLADRPRTLFPTIPYAVYLVVGKSFYGFHIRFTEIARGGIRLILSRDGRVYKKNCATLLEENYNLAFTQQLKNKDIPEGGSKGTILMDVDSQNLNTSGREAFNNYVDALLDCILSKETGIYSNLSKPEMLFFGPDENTAGFMKLGALRAKARGYTYWKSLTTGKSDVLGGIPHDKYAMTTNSIHPYVTELLEKLGLEESKLTKVMSGGPD
ncbi:glutamate dehydrogenase, putative, partial [Perkinsus marinus ATCC 50983]